jgi:hypothetical protein
VHEQPDGPQDPTAHAVRQENLTPRRDLLVQVNSIKGIAKRKDQRGKNQLLRIHHGKREGKMATQSQEGDKTAPGEGIIITIIMEVN